MLLGCQNCFCNNLYSVIYIYGLVVGSSEKGMILKQMSVCTD